MKKLYTIIISTLLLVFMVGCSTAQDSSPVTNQDQTVVGTTEQEDGTTTSVNPVVVAHETNEQTKELKDARTDKDKDPIRVTGKINDVTIVPDDPDTIYTVTMTPEAIKNDDGSTLVKEEPIVAIVSSNDYPEAELSYLQQGAMIDVEIFPDSQPEQSAYPIYNRSDIKAISYIK